MPALLFFAQFLDPVKAGQPTRVEVTFTNKLKVHMTNVIYSINGRGLTRTMVQERYAANSLLAVFHDLAAENCGCNFGYLKFIQAHTVTLFPLKES